MIETGWLIENRYTPGPAWWMGTDSPEQWTPDSLKAVRFCRKQDAEAAMATLPEVHMCFVSEHQYGFGDSLAALYREAVKALEAVHHDCPGWRSESEHDCHGDERACQVRCPVEVQVECDVCAVLAKAHAAGIGPEGGN